MTIRKDVNSWLEKQQIWKKVALFDVISSKEILDVDIERYLSICLENPEIINTVVIDDLIKEKTHESYLKKIKNVKGINALSSNQTLEFIPQGINVIYGDNGTGKSGYIRLLKKLINSRYEEELLSNVFEHSDKERSVEIEFVHEGDTLSYEIDLDNYSKNEHVTNILIFDTLASESYIRDSNESSYEPLILSRLIKLISIMDKVRLCINGKIKDTKYHEITIPNELLNHCLFKEGIKYSSYSVEYFEQQQFTEDDCKNLIELEKIVINKNPNTQKQELIRTNEVLDWTMNYLKNLYKVVNKQNVEFINQCMKKIVVESEIFEVVKEEFSSSLSCSDKNEINTEHWKKMWEYVKEYITRSPDSNDTCPVCKQDLKETASNRFEKILNFINHENKKTMNQLEHSIRKIVTITKEEIKTEKELELIVGSIRISDHLKKMLQELLIELSISATILINTNYLEKKEIILSVKDEKVEKILGQIKDVYSENMKALELLTNLNYEEYFNNIENEILELKKRKFETEHKEMLIANAKINKYRQKLEAAKVSTSTNTTTTLVKKIAKQILGVNYTDEFNNELSKLTDNKLQVILKEESIRKGKIPFKLVVANEFGEEFPPDKVFSEGERRILSIAAFLADSGLNGNNNTIILDDPISSLDDHYEALVCKRIIEISQDRQVIVFTHRLSLVFGLHSRALEQGILFKDCSIRANSKNKGIISESILSKRKVKPTLNKLMNTDLPKLKKEAPFSEEYDFQLDAITKTFRTMVEKSIEDVLTEGVISRFNPVIHSNNVRNLALITEKDCQIIESMMSKYSFYAHSHSEEKPISEIDLEDLEKDLTSYNEWFLSFNKRKKDKN